MTQRPNRTPEAETLERRKDARHEAGHAVAALHYDCPIENVSIGSVWPVRGTTRIGVSKPSDAVILFCGPLAECAWATLPVGGGILSPSDREALQYLGLSNDEYRSWEKEASAFLAKPEVQQQIDRVGRESGDVLKRLLVAAATEIGKKLLLGEVKP